MSPITHLLAGWMLANAGGLGRRDRAVVTLAGVIPDLDGFGAPFEALTRESERPIRWFSEYHHTFGHNIFAGIAVTIGALAVARKGRICAALAAASFHLHLLCDLAGAQGPDGSPWPILYLWPWEAVAWTWSGQWELNAWPNFVITGGLILATLALAWRRGFSVVEIVSAGADRRVVEALRSRFGEPGTPGGASRETPGSGDASA